MQTRTFGRLWPVSVLSIGGAGLGHIWGKTDRKEAVATLRHAIDGGINLIDVAPRYGEGEAERVVGEAFGGKLPAGVHISTKHHVGNPPAREVFSKLETALAESLDRMQLSFIDIYFLHSSIVSRDDLGNDKKTPLNLFVNSLRPAFERLMAQGRIGTWGITAVEMPSAVRTVLSQTPAPGAAQCITNPLDSAGEMKWSDEPGQPRSIIAAAKEVGTGVMGIRAVQAGALTDRIDRKLPKDNPVMKDFETAAPFRAIAHDLEESAASLAHRYAMSMDGVDTVVLGVKNREELRELLDAEKKGALPLEIVRRIDNSVAQVKAA
jgi:aryl-alcohol dehydrogenase-like predicted oxidoreductase